MIERKPSGTTEIIAEGTHASLALIAVILLSRAHSGALQHSPPAWVALLISSLIWAAAIGAFRWSPPSSLPWFAVWRRCVSPALISLIVGGQGGVSLLLGELIIVAIGIVVLGPLAYRASRCSEPDVTTSKEAVPFVAESLPVSLSCRETPAPIPAPTKVTEGTSAPILEAESGLRSESINWPSFKNGEERQIQRVDPAHNLGALQRNSLSTLVEEAAESHVDPEAESWTRRELDGEVSIEAVVMARFAEGAKHAVLHLPFVPPLPEIPQIECEPLDAGCDVSITTESAFRYGVRLNVTRHKAGPPESVPIGIVIYTSVEEEIESE